MSVELKHIAAYLPYNITVQKRYCKEDIIKLTVKNISFVLSNNDYLILRPLSDLTKEIEVDGKKIVPIVELLKLNGGFEYYEDIFERDVQIIEIGIKKRKPCNEYFIKYNFQNMGIHCFYILSNGDFCDKNESGSNFPTFYHRKMAEYMDSLWFDFDNLIESGDAIDINTLQ